MSSLIPTGSASGTGSMTLVAPITSSIRTLTLPDTTGTLITESMTLLGTLTTTSGTSQILSGLDLTPYKFLVCWFDNVSFTTTASLSFGGVVVSSALGAAGNGNCGWLNQNLTTGICTCFIEDFASTGNVNNASGAWYLARNGYVNATNSITFAGGTFDAGTITVYGVK